MNDYNTVRTWASGDMCPIMKPWDPPEKRPSVMSATSLPNPAPIIALVGVSISGIPMKRNKFLGVNHTQKIVYRALVNAAKTKNRVNLG